MNSFSLAGLTRMLISDCTSRMEFATTNGSLARPAGEPGVLRADHQRRLAGVIGDPLVDQRLLVLRGLQLPVLAPLIEPVEQPESDTLTAVIVGGPPGPIGERIDDVPDQPVTPVRSAQPLSPATARAAGWHPARGRR